MKSILEHVAVLPGLVNAHTHLELSWMRGRIPETDDFSQWIRTVIELKGEAASHGEEVALAIDEAVREARAFGTALVGDITNTLATSRPLREHGMAGVVFHELLGFRSEDARSLMQEATARGSRTRLRRISLRHTLAPHAPYSVSPALFGSDPRGTQRDPFARSSVHLGESAAEIEFLEHGTGPWRTGLERMGKWDASWVPPRCGPVEYLDRMGFLDDRVLVVHGVQFGGDELKRLAARGATLVTCPRGNVRTGAGDSADRGVLRIRRARRGRHRQPRQRSRSEPVRRACGDEAAGARRFRRGRFSRAPRSTARGRSASRPISGHIDAGKRDALVAVRLDGHVPGVEEYLVSGIEAEQIGWIPAS